MAVVIIILAIFMLLLFLLLVLIFSANSMIYGHDLPTSRRATRSVFDVISQYRSTKEFYDLGCAHGSFSVRIKRKFPLISVHGVDNDPIRIFFARIRALIFRSRVEFSREDIFDVDLSNANIVYIYLWYDLMPLLEKKLQRELKHGTIVITNTSNFPTWKAAQKIVTYPKIPKTPDFETLFVYQKI